MRIGKAFSLAAVAGFAAMAFIGVSSASAQHKIALCTELVTLCGELVGGVKKGDLWAAGTVLTALAKEPKLHSELGTISCEDSIVKGELNEALGSPLLIKNPTVVFGVLPTPTLGAGCTGPCTNGSAQNIHVTLENLQVEVEATNKYFLKGSGLALLLHCGAPFFDLTCVYRGENILVPIAHDGSHNAMAGNNLPLAKFEVQLQRQTTHGGSGFPCPATSEWLANYVLYLAGNGLAWPSLDK